MYNIPGDAKYNLDEKGIMMGVATSPGRYTIVNYPMVVTLYVCMYIHMFRHVVVVRRRYYFNFFRACTVVCACCAYLN